jgi:hypothetical protein
MQGEYLDRDPIPATYEIDDNSIKISSNSTMFATCRRHFHVTSADIIEAVRAARAAAKAAGVSFSASMTIKELEARPDTFNDNFDEIREQAQKVEGYRIRYGYRDDEELGKLTRLIWDYQSRAREDGRAVAIMDRAHKITDMKADEVASYTLLAV